MSPVEIIGLLNSAQSLLPSVTGYIDIFKKISSEVTIEDVEKLRSEIELVKEKEEAALEEARKREGK